MTDQLNKPVRSREEQVVDLVARIFVGMRNHTDSMCEAQRHIEEAEARGMSEQRRKDAEGPVAYTSQIDLDRVRKGKSGDIYSTQKWEGSDDAVFTIPLYTHPANVAALEGRIAELEKERDQYREGYQEMEALRKFYATNERHLKVVALARDVLASDGAPS